jgi:hypothetical protein
MMSLIALFGNAMIDSLSNGKGMIHRDGRHFRFTTWSQWVRSTLAVRLWDIILTR